MWGITAYTPSYSDTTKQNTFRFRGPSSTTATSATDQMWINIAGLVTSRGGFAKSGSSDSYILLAGGGTKAISDFQASGDYVVGPASATDNAITRYNGTTGKIVQNSSATLDDSGNLKIAGNFYVPAQKYAYFGTNKLATFRANDNGAFIVGAYDDIYFRGNLDSNDSAQAVGVQLSKTYLKPEATNTMALGASDKIWSNVYSRQLTSTVATGTAPLVVTSTTAVTNLNADMLDGKHASAFALTSDIPDVSDFITEESDTLQTVTNRGNSTTNIIKIQNGDAGGSFVLGANVNSTTLTANNRKLGRMGVPSYDSTTKTVAGISFDSQQNVNLVDFGGHPNNAQSIAPDVIRFVVANSHNNAADGARTLALQISKQNGLVDSAGGGTSVAAAKFFIPVQTTSSITSNEGFIHGGLTAATGKTKNDYVLLAGGNTKPISDFALDSEIPDVSDFVTKSTAQTISGKKTFSGGLAITSADQNTNMIYFLGIDAFASGGAVKWTNKSDIKLPYSQITGTPTIPTVNNGTLTIQRNGTTVATFTANQAGNTTANITDNDTLNTAGSTNDEAKLYLVGAKSQAASAQTYSDAQVYTQAGELNATSVCVAEHGQIRYDATNECIRFVIA